MARTTVTDIAERAGVGRLSVYRHFPDELTLGWGLQRPLLGAQSAPRSHAVANDRGFA